jgi:transcriptional regulator with XRE-family HTH domain
MVITICKVQSITICNKPSISAKKQFTNRNNCIRLISTIGEWISLGYKTTNQFARVVAREMKRKSLSLSQLAIESGISEPYLSLILSGQRNPPGPEKIDKMTRALGLRPPMLHLLAGYIPQNDPTWSKFFDRVRFMDDDEVDKLLAFVRSLPKKRRK